jgi:indole-3-glycerol phosphate synthase
MKWISQKRRTEQSPNKSKLPEYRPKDKMPVSLDQILEQVRREIPALHGRRASLEESARSAPARCSLSAALRGDRVAVIAEVKRRSPSAGVIREDLDPAERAALYAGRGAAAISVLTDGPFFGGSISDLRAAAGRVSAPLLRKDFILDELQVMEARAAGASGILLIVRALSPSRLAELLACTREWQLEALVEVHSMLELETALRANARIIGINSRDLDTFRIDSAAAWRVLAQVPAGHLAVAESGMAGAPDVERAAAAGADAVLVGTALSAAPDPGALVERLARIPRRDR